ncbi:MAG: type II secretion system protein M [Reinekea sp.]
MPAVFEPLIERWMGLSRRDQQVAVGLSVALVVAIVVFGLIVPIAKKKADAEQNYDSASSVLNELVSLAPQAMATGNSSGPKNPNSLNSDIRRLAARNGVEIQRFEPDGDFLKVWLEDVRYPSVVQWLGALEATGIEHLELTMEDRPKPGFVSVRVTFGYRQ